MRWVRVLASLGRAGGLCAALGMAGCGDRDASKAPAARGATGTEAPAAPRSVEGPASAAAASTAASAAPLAVATLRGKVRDDLDALTIVALAAPDAPSESAQADTASVATIEIRGSDGVLRQRIDGLHARIASAGGLDALELVDLDFDGHADLRLREAPSAGPNTTHVNWLFDPAGQRFVPIPALDALPGVQVDAAARELRSAWRDGPATYGSDAYVIRGGQLVPVRRERRTYSQPGRFTLEVSRPKGTGWKVVQKRAGRD